VRKPPIPDSPALDRRLFLARSAASAAALATGLVGGPSIAAPSPGAARSPRSSALDLEEATFSDLAEGIETGRYTTRGIVEAYLSRIEEIDRKGPTINTILEVNPDALQIADQLDAERKARGPRSRLHGIPILLKDNIGTADRMHTSAGSLALADSIAPRDAGLVRRLRDAGCLILGKANMSEWANARGRASIGGWSARGRLTRNPYVLDRSAGGSSSGTAAAVSANLVAAAIGTETMGSIVSPSSLCGIVGMKPTVGLVSRSGVIPVSYTQDTAGPMCRTVRDAAMLLSVIAGPDATDKATARIPDGFAFDFDARLDPSALRGARIGIARNLFGTSLLADRVAERAIDALSRAGAVIVENANIATADGIWPLDSELLSYELKASLNEYLASLGPNAKVKTLADLIAFNTRNSDRELEWFGQETFLYAQQLGPLTSPEYVRLKELVHELAGTKGIDATVKKHELQAIVAPTQSPAWLIDVFLGDNTTLGSFIAPAAAGYPSITVPAGDSAGLPVGLLFFGPAWSDGTLLRLAYAFEQLVKARRPPTFVPTISVRP
jgi:amidase